MEDDDDANLPPQGQYDADGLMMAVRALAHKAQSTWAKNAPQDSGRPTMLRLENERREAPMKRYRPKRRVNRDEPDERRSFKKDLWPADTEFTEAIQHLQFGWRNPSWGGRRSRYERRAWQYLIEVVRRLPLHERERSE
jgi:hypothetical protein